MERVQAKFEHASNGTSLGYRNQPGWNLMVGQTFTAPGFAATVNAFTFWVDDCKDDCDLPLRFTAVLQEWNAGSRGQIVGSYRDATGRHGFLDSGGSFTPISVLSASNTTSPNGINASGQIVESIRQSPNPPACSSSPPALLASSATAGDGSGQRNLSV